MPPRSYSELLEKLRNQVGFQRRSTEAFDSGHKEEGERLALGTRVLLHDTSQSHSLLGQLGTKAALRFTDSSLHVESETKNLGGGRFAQTSVVHAGLVLMTAEVGSSGSGPWGYAPVLAPEEGSARDNPPVAFEQWWNRAFLTDTDGLPVTRRSVTLAVANNDGGAHVAKAIPAAYERLRSGQGLPLRTGTEDAWHSIPGVVMATMRQIAFELLDTLERDLPSFIRGFPVSGTVVLTGAEKAGLPRNEECLCGSGQKFKRCHGS